MNIKGGYWLAKDAANYPVENIPANYFTHLFYASVDVDNTNYHRVKITQEDIEIRIPEFLCHCHQENEKKQAFLSIGGPNSNSTSSSNISNMASNYASRSLFISSTMKIARDYRFDGFELSWQSPRTQEDMDNMALLFKEWREKINKSAKPDLLLAATVYFQSEIPRENGPIQYPVDAIRTYLDFINIVLYDYSPASTVTTGQVFIHPNHSISNWTTVDDGVPANKLVMGIPLYGHKWTLADPNDNGIGAPVTAFNGTVPYKDIPSRNQGKYDQTTLSEYVADGFSWFGYDGQRSLGEKIQYAKDKKLGGYFLYPLGYDNDSNTLARAGFNA